MKYLECQREVPDPAYQACLKAVTAGSGYVARGRRWRVLWPIFGSLYYPLSKILVGPPFTFEHYVITVLLVAINWTVWFLGRQLDEKFDLGFEAGWYSALRSRGEE